MARFINPEVLSVAIDRLLESRSSRSMLNFLIFKRAISLANSAIVSFSARSDSYLVKAVEDLAACSPNSTKLPHQLHKKPYINVFDSSGSPWLYLGSNWRTNGTGPALSGAVWRGVIDIVSERPRKGQLAEGYTQKLASVVMKAGTKLPGLTDAAIWYHRATDVQAQFGDVTDSAELDERLRASFIEALGLTNEEIALLFDVDAKPLAELPLSQILTETVADPQNYLPDLGGDNGELHELIAAFKAHANRPTVGLRVNRALLLRFVAALGAKRFLILSGLAGSGKTKLAQAFARWLTPAVEDDQPKAYAVVPVGADWTGNDNILGYPDGLDPTRYVTRPALDLIQRAAQPERADTPHFLILDEMNLSHVERYFADLLSLIESNETTELYRPSVDENGQPQYRAGAAPLLRLPPNLFIVGTVNVDETTYMFSPKVLDRANVIEFRMERAELEAFLAAPRSPDLDALNGLGRGFGAAFVAEVAKSVSAPEAVRERFSQEMLLFFDLLRDHNSEFGFRMANEAARFLHFYHLLGGYDENAQDWFDTAMDAVIVQKLLPKLHGSRPQMEGLLWALAWACGADRSGRTIEKLLDHCREAGKTQEETKYGPEVVERQLADGAAHYPLSFDKIMRMWRKLIRDQFVTFAEA